MKVLILDNNIDRDSWGSPELRRVAALAPGGDFLTRRPPHRDLPADPRAFDRIIVSGSKTAATDDAPWIDELLEFIRRAADAAVPFLGVCYGHQSLVRALGGKELVRRAERGEFGWTRIEAIAESPILAGVPRAFHSYSFHHDEVAALPAGMRNLARSEACAIQACELTGKPVFGIQFHPEKNLEEGERSLANRQRAAKTEPERRELLGIGQGAKLYDADIGARIFGNFLRGDYLKAGGP